LRIGCCNIFAGSVYADVISGDSFWPAMTLKLSQRYDLSGTNYMLLGGDGAGWIREGAEYLKSITRGTMI